METKTKGVIIVLALITAFAVGRFSSPEKIKIEKVVVEVEKKTKDTHKETKTVEKTNPDGSKSTETTIVEDTKEKEYSKSKESDKKEVAKSSSRTNIHVLSGVNAGSVNGLFYGAHVSRDVLGPISIGVWAFTNKTTGVSVGLSF